MSVSQGTGKGEGRGSAMAPCIMVIFGASGDLTERKLMPALYNLDMDDLLPDDFAVVGFARTRMDDGEFRRRTRSAIERHRDEAPFDEGAWERFSRRLHYVPGEYGEAAAYEALGARVRGLKTRCGASRTLYYLSVPPSVAETALDTMREAGLAGRGGDGNEDRVMMEKPFGRDLEGARRLNRLVAESFAEDDVYRVDHYLGKDTVRNLLLLRFANLIFEPLWSRNYVDNVQITTAESLGVAGRGGYYEESGVVRDMVQNHVLQVISLIAMDPPVAGDATSIQDRKYEVLKSMRAVRPGDFVFGQYEGYRGEKGVAPDSGTPTFAALRLWVDNWRWHGVPFYIRAGKELARKVSEVTVVFRDVPVCILETEELCRGVRPNVIFLRIQPDEGVRLSLSVKAPGRGDEITTASMDFSYSQLGRKIPNAYERVLLDGLSGVKSVFWRADAVERAWKIVEPLLEAEGTQAGRPVEYACSGWGPEEAENLLKQDGRRWISSY